MGRSIMGYTIINDEPQRVAINAISFSPDIYPRDFVRYNKVDEYITGMQNGDVFPPPVVNKRTGNGLDGLHRYLAKKKMGEIYLYVDYLDIDPKDELMVAMKLNAKHGIQLTPEEKRSFIKRAFNSNPNVDLRRLAKDLGVSMDTVWAHTEEMRHQREEHRNSLILRLGRKHKPCANNNIQCNGKPHSTREIADILSKFGYSLHHSQVSRHLKV